MSTPLRIVLPSTLAQRSLISSAAPVASATAVSKIGQLADEVVCPYVEEEFYAVGEFYRDFSQVSDEVVVRALAGRL
jgi:predicted phosphoribosyltransferase